jgi:hypothetical protein
VGKAARLGQMPGHGVGIERRRFALRARAASIAHGHHVEIAPIGAEGVEIARIFRAPADELDPQLEAAWCARNARSSMPRVWLNMRIGGIVASPTPIVPISSLSTRVMAQSRASACDSIAAVIQPAEPPPTISTLRILRSFMMLPS